MLIGLGGGAASSSASGESSVELDFDSVQRGNPEMERRAQMVIDACVALGENNPIAFIHDVGAGGLSNALPELVKDAGYGGQFELRQVESADSSMSPLQIWCCEAQERYVMIVNAEGMNRFVSIASKLISEAISSRVYCILRRHNLQKMLTFIQDENAVAFQMLAKYLPKITMAVLDL